MECSTGPNVQVLPSPGAKPMGSSRGPQCKPAGLQKTPGALPLQVKSKCFLHFCCLPSTHESTSALLAEDVCMRSRFTQGPLFVLADSFSCFQVFTGAKYAQHEIISFLKKQPTQVHKCTHGRWDCASQAPPELSIAPG